MKRKTKAQILFEKYHKANCGKDIKIYKIAKEDFTNYLIILAYQGKLYSKDSNGNIQPIKNLNEENENDR